MKRIAFLCLAVVLALGTMGVGFALWSETLYIDGTVFTGELAVEWSQDVPYDNEPPEKDFSWAECYIELDTIYITIYNAYPSITYTIPIDIHNIGTIPMHVCGLVVTGGNLPACSTVTFPDWFSIQLHPSESEWGEITVHLCNEAEENMIYSFTAELTVVQWNEPCPAPA
jgi:hypothetical protein